MKAPRVRPWTLAAGLVIAVGIVWMPALRGGFVWDDDFDIVRSDRLHHLGAVVDVFRHHAMWAAGEPETAVATYRPLALASLAIDYALFGLDPVGYHATSILLHVLATLAVFVALRRLIGEPVVAAGLAFVCAVHPANAEAVAWINGRSEILALLFGALAIWASAARRWPIVAVALFAALLAKETGAVFVLVAVSVSWAVSRAVSRSDAQGERVRLGWQAPAAAAVAVVAYATLRSLALGASTLPGGSALRAVLVLPSVWARSAQAVLVPLERSPAILATWLESIGPGERLAYAAVALALVGITVLLAVRRRFLAVIGIGWWLVSLAPLATLAILDYPWPGLARWLYIGMPGLALFAWDALLHRLGGRARLVVGLAVAAACIGLAWRAIPVWHDDTTLYATMIEENPDDGWPRRALGTDQLMTGHFPEAAELYLGAGERDRGLERAGDLQLASYAWTFLGRCAEAVSLYRRQPPSKFVFPDRFADAAAGCYARRGDRARARQLWSQCAAVNPSCAEGLAQTPP